MKAMFTNNADLTNAGLSEVAYPDSTAFNPFTNPDPNSVDDNLFGTDVAFDNTIAPEATTSEYTGLEGYTGLDPGNSLNPQGMSIVRVLHATPLLPQITYAAVGSFEIGQIELDPTAPSGLVETVGYPAICSVFRQLNPDKTDSALYTATYGEGGLIDGEIQGYHTLFCTKPHASLPK
jgi:hypothetical protein